MSKKMPYTVPQGYFETLDQRMMAAIAAEENKKSPRRRPLVPYFALAGFVAALVTAGTFFLRSVTDRVDEDGYGQILSESQLTDEDIFNYLIDSGCSTDYFADAL